MKTKGIILLLAALAAIILLVTRVDNNILKAAGCIAAIGVAYVGIRSSKKPQGNPPAS